MIYKLQMVNPFASIVLTALGASVMSVLRKLCGDLVVVAVEGYQRRPNRPSVLSVLKALLAWAKVQEVPGCFVDAYLSVGPADELKTYH